MSSFVLYVRLESGVQYFEVGGLAGRRPSYIPSGMYLTYLTLLTTIHRAYVRSYRPSVFHSVDLKNDNRKQDARCKMQDEQFVDC